MYGVNAVQRACNRIYVFKKKVEEYNTKAIIVGIPLSSGNSPFVLPLPPPCPIARILDPLLECLTRATSLGVMVWTGPGWNPSFRQKIPSNMGKNPKITGLQPPP